MELTAMISTNSFRVLEARVGIEPTHKGFADLSLTTWVPRPELECPACAGLESINPPGAWGNHEKNHGAGDGS
jgi:hypothetical protein